MNEDERARKKIALGSHEVRVQIRLTRRSARTRQIFELCKFTAAVLPLGPASHPALYVYTVHARTTAYVNLWQMCL